jgi:hypothetical protein
MPHAKRLYHDLVKIKRMHRISFSQAIVLPAIWIKDMDLTKYTNLIMTYHPYEKEIIIRKGSELTEEEIKEIGRKKDGKEVSQFIDV